MTADRFDSYTENVLMKNGERKIKDLPEILLRKLINKWPIIKIEESNVRQLANSLTLTRALINVGVATAFANGSYELGYFGISLGAVTDMFDGAVLRVIGEKHTRTYYDAGWWMDLWADLGTAANVVFLTALKLNGS